MRATGHEDEFRRLFEEEARTRLAALAGQALELEQGATEPELFDAMLRHAHTIKGSAAVVGFAEIADVVHHLEQLLSDARAGHGAAPQALAEAVLGTADALTDMVARAIAGDDQQGARLAAEAALARAAGGALVPHPPAPAPAPAEPPAHAEPAASIPVPVRRLDEFVRLVGEGTAAQLRVGRLISERLGDDPRALDEYRQLARVLGTLQEQAMRARMVAVGSVAGPLRRAVRDLARSAGKQVRWEIAGADTELDRHVLERLREPLVALARNAVDHGIEPPRERERQGKPAEGLIRIHAMQVGADVIISVADDGRGIDVERVRRAAGGSVPLSDDEAFAAIFRPGLTTAEEVTGVSGRGVGLDAVREAVDELRGRVEVHSSPGRGSEFRISVPMTLAVVRCLLVQVAGRPYALNLGAVVALLADPREDVSAEGRPAVWTGGDAVPLSDLSEVLGTEGGLGGGPVAVVATSTGRHAFRVEALLGQRDVVVNDVGRVLPRIDLLAGASVEPDGSVMLVLDPQGLIDAAAGRPRTAVGSGGRRALAPAERRRERILVVDDATTIRELVAAMLQRAGFDVVVAASGEEALDRLDGADLVVTDVEMPGMDGFALTRAIRAVEAHRHLPVMILTSRTGDADRRRGMEAGADGYLVKRDFDEHALLGAVRHLLDSPQAG